VILSEGSVECGIGFIGRCGKAAIEAADVCRG
jgi:hypothetical protein